MKIRIFFLRPISLENIDEAVFRTFNRRWKVNGKELEMLMLDMDVAAMRFMHAENFDKVKEYLNLPYFTCWRMSSGIKYRSSPSNKPIVYTFPTQKPQGVVWEEYITPSPTILKFPYIIKFISTRRENINAMEKNMLDYFKNKRNIIKLDGERFEIYPKNFDEIATLDVGKRGDEGKALYTLTYNLEVLGYLRDIKDMQKRERPNTFKLNISERTSRDNEKNLDTTIIQTESKI